MANEFVHGSVGTELTQAEWEGVGTHVFNSQATGDIVYASSATQLSRLAISGTATHILSISGGVPVWAAPAAAAAGSLTGSTLASGVTASSLTSVGTIATGTWEGTDVGVAYGGTGVSTLTDNAVLTGTGASAITAESNLTFDGTTLTVATGKTLFTTGEIGIGAAVPDDNYAIYMLYDFGEVDNTIQGFSLNVSAHETGGVADWWLRGLDVDARIGASNTQNWTHTVGMRALETGVTINGSASGTMNGVAGLYVTNATSGGMTITKQYGIYMDNLTGGSTNVGIDMGNNTLENVGASGNDWTSAALLHKGTSNSRFERTGSVLDAGRTALILQHTTDGNMADGFGVFMDFHLEDATASDANMGFLGMERAGADNLSKFTLTLNNSGSYNEAIQVSAAGVLSVDLGSGTGTDADHTEIDVFDDYDDPVELQRYTHMQSEKYSTIDERATSFEKMLDMGIISEVPEASSGYHMNLQPMVRLLAGGIYQNRERMDAQNEAMDARLKRIEQALGV